MNLEQKILNTKPREESGSKTSRKYVFQNDLSLFILIDQHNKRNDYLFLFDFHEDLVIIDSPTLPDKIDFYQIKSKDTKGNWTINNLTKAKKDKLSILGKLYLNKINFPNNTKSLNFISNSTYGFKKLKNGFASTTMTKINASDLESTDLTLCNDKILVEHNLNYNPEIEKLTEFHVTNLSNQDSSTHCIGALTRLINSINPNNSINPELAYNQVTNEISRRARNSVGDKSINDIDKLIEIKGITKIQFLNFLERAGLYKSVEQEWQEIKSSLENSGIGYIELLKYKSAWRDVNARIIRDPNNIPLQELTNQVESEYNLKKQNTNVVNIKLVSLINDIQKKIKNEIFDDYFVKCLIIKIIHES